MSSFGYTQSSKNIFLGEGISMRDIDIIGQLADLKEIDYRNTLAISALIELLIEKGFFTRQEFARKAADLENATVTEINAMRMPKFVK
jgi:hypothetical protein